MAAVVFDLDGVLVDSETTWDGARRELAAANEAVHRLGARFPLGPASSSPRRLIDAVLDAAAIADRFAATVWTEEVAAGKPGLTVLGVPNADFPPAPDAPALAAVVVGSLDDITPELPEQSVAGRAS